MTDCKRRWTLLRVNLYDGDSERCTREQQRRTYTSKLDGTGTNDGSYFFTTIFCFRTAQRTRILG